MSLIAASFILSILLAALLARWLRGPITQVQLATQKVSDRQQISKAREYYSPAIAKLLQLNC